MNTIFSCLNGGAVKKLDRGKKGLSDSISRAYVPPGQRGWWVGAGGVSHMPCTRTEAEEE